MVTLVFAQFLTCALAATVNLDSGKSTVEFFAIGKPSFLKIHGTGAKPKGKFVISPQRKVSGTATLDLNSLDTGLSLRNKHMKEKYLQTDKYPQAKLTLTDFELPEDFDKPEFSEEGIPFEGKLSLHGVEQPVKGTASVVRKQDSIEVKTEFPAKISDYKIETPGFRGITVADEVKVDVKISGKLQ